MFSAVVGGLHVLPDIVFIWNLGPEYKGVHFIAAVDETTYLSRISRVLAGDYRLGNAVIFEHRNDPFTYAPLPEYVLGTIGRLLQLSVAQLDVAATAVLPSLLFLFFALLIRELTGRFWLSLIGAVVLMLGQYLIAKDSPLLHGRLYDPSFPYSLQFVRPVSPQFHYLVFVPALWLLYRLYAKRGTWKLVLGTGVLWGLAFYLNFFFWTFLAGGIVLWGIVSVLKTEYERCRVAMAVLAVGATVGMYYFVNAYSALSTQAFYEASLRTGFIYTHQPVLPLVHVLWFVAFWMWFWRHRESVPGQFVLFFLVSGFLCLNQQVITGRTVQPFHWETQTNRTVMFLSFFVVLAGVLSSHEGSQTEHRGRRLRLATGAFAVAVILVLLAHAILVQENYYRKNQMKYADLQKIWPSLWWLKQNTPAGSVVLANPAIPLLSELVAVYAQRFTFLSEPFFTVSLIPQEEIDDRYMLAMRIFGFEEAGLQRVLRHTSGSLFLGIQVLPYYHRGKDQPVVERLDRVAERYRRITAGLDPAPPLGTLKLDYVLASLEESHAIRRDLFGAVREVHSDGLFQILEVRKGRTEVSRVD